ncbi:transmembrane protein 69 [Nesidiocoris tenuis]|uniref:Transmembrane protein 69 n=1 Tax=Nesidiocoris tenuis TaxID=355587 RepID=A0ABN7AWY1_9HEMI|nr:transmembrane protein 69 [Nesidiocoris tenuis]
MFSLCRRALIDTGLNNIGSSRLICQLPPRTFQANSTDEKQQTRTRFLPFHITCGHGSSNFGIQFVQFSRHKSTTTTMPLDFTVAKSQFVANLKDIHLADAKDAPAPIFWSGMLGLVPIVLPPLSFLLFGYSNSLATMQMTFAATISAFLAGTKYGTHVARPETARGVDVVASIAPQFAAFTGLLLPQAIGFPLIAGSIALAGFVDLTTGDYPPWYKAMRLGLTATVLASLSLTCLIKLFSLL